MLKAWVISILLAVGIISGIVFAVIPREKQSHLPAITTTDQTQLPQYATTQPNITPVNTTQPNTPAPQPTTNRQSTSSTADSDYQLAQICLNSHIQIGNSVLSMYRFYDNRELSQESQELDLLTNIQHYPEGWSDTYQTYIAKTKAEAHAAKQQVYDTALATEQKDSCRINVLPPTD